MKAKIENIYDIYLMRMDCNSIEYQWFARAVTDFQMYNKYSLLELDCTKQIQFYFI